ncbi:MAG: tetratricopeptide repeat protein [Candidatus Polarisedimenticolia bacterium]
MICPMLSALKPADDYGHPVNRECIYEECRFFSLEKRDCNLMMASQAMLRMAEAGPPRDAASGGDGAEAIRGRVEELDRRLTEVRRDLLQSSLELQGVVRESGQGVLDTVTVGETRVAEAIETLAARLGELKDQVSAAASRLDAASLAAAAPRPDAPSPRDAASPHDLASPHDSAPRETDLSPAAADALAGRIGVELRGLLEAGRQDTRQSLGQALQQIEMILGQVLQAIEATINRKLQPVDPAAAPRSPGTENLAPRLHALERAVGETSVALRRQMEEGLLTLATRLENQGGGGTGSEALVAQILAQMGGVAQTQQKMAGRLLEEMSRVQATAAKLERVMGPLEKKLEKSTEESLQVQQLLTLIKGQTEKTFASLRSVNEGNRTVLQALETQLQRDQEALKLRRHEEAVECNSRGVVLYFRGALDGAVEAFRRAVELQPEYGEAQNNLGLALSRLGRQEEAETAFQEALRLDPGMGEVFNNLGFLYHATAKYPQAIEMFRKAIDTAADSSVAYTNLGNSFYKLKQHDKAVAAWKRALELDPMNENARRGLRMFHQDAGSN